MTDKSRLERNVNVLYLSVAFIVFTLYLTTMVDSLLAKLLLVYFLCSVVGFTIWYIVWGEKRHSW